MNYPDKIIDAHHHLWNPIGRSPEIGYVWLSKIGALKPFGDPTPIQRDYLLEEFLAESAVPLIGSVHVQADGAIPDPIAETAFIHSLSEQSRFPISIVGFVDLAHESAETTILRHKQHKSVTGIRQILSRLEESPKLSFAPEDYLKNPTWRENFNLLKEHNLSFDLQIYPEQMHDSAKFLSNHPEISVIIDHAGCPYDESKIGFENWKSGMIELSELKNISTKISGLGMFDLHPSGKRNAKPYLELILEYFGKERVMFGSNFPVDKLMSSYDNCIENITRLLPTDMTGKLWQSAIFHDNAKRIYKL